MRKPDINQRVLLPPTPEEKRAIYFGCIAMFLLLMFLGTLTYFLTINKSLEIKEKAHAESQYARV